MELDPRVTLWPAVIGYLINPFKRERPDRPSSRAMTAVRQLQCASACSPLMLDVDISEGAIVSSE